MLRVIALRLGRLAPKYSSHGPDKSRVLPSSILRGQRYASLWANDRTSRDDAPHLDGKGESRRSSAPRRFGYDRKERGEYGSGSSRDADRGSAFGLAKREDDNWISASEGGSNRRSFGRIMRPDRQERDDRGQGGSSRLFGRDADRDAPITRIPRDPAALPNFAQSTSPLLPPKMEIDIGPISERPEKDPNAIAGLSGSIVQEAKLDEFLDGFVEPEAEPVPEEPQQVEAPKSSGPAKFASYELPSESGVAIVKNLLQEHEFLHTQEIWKKGTQGRRRPIPEAYQYQPDGRIRMKSVSTMREGRRPWVPPAEAPFPDHPFKSTNFLKGILLHSLEEQGLVHKTFRLRPLETEEEHLAAIREAERVTRKRERRAMWEQERHGKDPGMPAPMEPVMSVKVYGWALGPNEEQVGEFDEAKWQKAERGERAYHEGKAREAIQAANRQFIRRTRYKEIREQDKAYREEDKQLGIHDDVKKEERRLQALDTIEHYSDVTGEDVSGWFEELAEDIGRAEPWRPTHLQPGGVIARKSRTRNMKPKGYPIV